MGLGAGQYLRPLRKDVLIYGLGVPSPPDSNTNPLSGLWSGSLWGPDRVVGRVRRPSCVSYRLRNRPVFRKPPPTPRLEQDRICPPAEETVFEWRSPESRWEKGGAQAETGERGDSRVAQKMKRRTKRGEISSCPVCQGQGRAFRGWMWGMDSSSFGDPSSCDRRLL